jgi:hypothetical protein
VSAPPLPEAFGNYALVDFVEVVSPAAISWLPQTTGWKVVGIALAALALYHGWRRLRHWYRNRYRREAATRLAQLARRGEGALLAADVNRLLKLTALAAFPREQVAQLHGVPWIEFLNRQCTSPPFNSAQADLLALGAYRAIAVDGADRTALVDSSLAWVREHGNPLDD